MSNRWDETWHRLLEWTAGQGAAEKLAAQVLLGEGFKDLDPSHPLGGQDGGMDVTCTRDGRRYIGGVYFPRGQKSFNAIRAKFTSDLKAACERNQAEAFVFVTNQELRLSERSELEAQWSNNVVIYHLERVAAVLDQPSMAQVRSQFLNIDPDPTGRGGDGGSGTVYGNRGTAVGGQAGRGGTGGPGGRGGAATVYGDDGAAVGGNGGAAGGADGRGGGGGRGPMDRYGSSTSTWGFGGGGRGGDAPEYTRRLGLLTQLRQEYMDRFAHDVPYILAGVDNVPVDWINQRLDELGEVWHVSQGIEGYVLPPLPEGTDE